MEFTEKSEEANKNHPSSPETWYICTSQCEIYIIYTLF